MNRITSAGFCLPVVLGRQLAIHADHSASGFGVGLWRDLESGTTTASGSTSTLGLDLGRLRLRLVADRVGTRRSTGWGWI